MKLNEGTFKIIKKFKVKTKVEHSCLPIHPELRIPTYFIDNTLFTILQDSPSRFHAISKPALRMRIWCLWKLRIIILKNIIIHINVK